MAASGTGFTDTWTILTDPLVTRGTVRLSFEVTGDSTLIGSGAGSATLRATAGTIDTVFTSVNGPGTYTLDMPIFVGTPQPVSVFLDLRAQTNGYGQTVSLDYGHTAVLTGLSFIADGEISPGAFTLDAAPEFTALAGGAEVPEPASIAMSGLGFAAMIAWRRRSRHVVH